MKIAPMSEEEAAFRSKVTFLVLLFFWAALFGFVWGYWHLSAAFASLVAYPIALFLSLGLLYSGMEKAS